ncbi:hypothetical protein [Arthrobacter sp. Z1-15]
MEDDHTIAAKLDHAIELLKKLEADGPRTNRTAEKFWALEDFENVWTIPLAMSCS